MPQLYTPVSNTIPGAQVQSGVDQGLIASANATQQSGQTFSPEMTSALSTVYGNAVNAVTNTNTPQTRQAILDSTGIPGMQSNYADLAQKLAGYDAAILKPEFAGTDPGAATAADMPAGFSPLTAMTGISMNNADTNPLGAEQGIYNSNPIYGFQAQGNQGNNILKLLGVLNDAIGKEYSRGSAEYGTKLSTAMSALQGISKLLELNTGLETTKAQLKNARDIAGMDNAMRLKIARISAGLEGMGGDTSLTGGNTFDLNGLEVIDPDRRQAIALYQSLPKNSDAAKKIADNWKASHDGQSLIPDSGLANILRDLNKVDNSVRMGTGSPIAGLVSVKKLVPGGVSLITDKKEQALADLDAKYFLLTQKILTSVQGSKPSDFDVRSYMQNTGPSIVNPPAVNDQRVANMMSMLGLRYVGSDVLPMEAAKTTDMSDPLGIR